MAALAIVRNSSITKQADRRCYRPRSIMAMIARAVPPSHLPTCHRPSHLCFTALIGIAPHDVDLNCLDRPSVSPSVPDPPHTTAISATQDLHPLPLKRVLNYPSMTACTTAFALSALPATATSGKSSFISSTSSQVPYSNRPSPIPARSAPRRSPRISMVQLTRDTANGPVKRIVVTGTGVTSCFGCDSDAFYQALLDGKSGVRRIESFDCESWSTNFAATVNLGDLDISKYVSPKLGRRLDPFLKYALIAGKQALAEAGLDDPDVFASIKKDRAGVLCGSGMGGLQIYSDGVQKLLERGYSKMSPFFIPYAITNMVCILFASSILLVSDHRLIVLLGIYVLTSI